MNRLFKVFGVIAASIAILVSLSFSVFANATCNRQTVCSWFMVSNTSDFYSGLQSTTYTAGISESEEYFWIKEDSSAKSFQRFGWAASFIPSQTAIATLPTFSSNKVGIIDVTVQDKTSAGYLVDYSKYFQKVFLSLSDGKSYEITPNVHYDPDTSEYSFRFIQKFTCSEDITYEALTFYCNIPSGSQGWAKYDICFDFDYSTADINDAFLNDQIVNEINTSTQEIVSSINGQTQEIKNAVDASADKITGEIQNSTDQITGEIQDSTDQITNGWETDDDSSNRVDDMTGDFGNAENDALGGKTDEEIQEEVNNALSDYELPDETLDNVSIVGDTFLDLLEAFGAEYQSVMVLALTLGLAAFLVGRSYTAKGE